MKFKSFGCSFIFGSDLQDCHYEGAWPQGSPSTWPALVAQTLACEYQCHARPGAGNLQIAETILNQLDHDSEDFFIISWSWIDRFDYKHDCNAWPFWNTIRPNNQDHASNMYYKNLHSEYADKLVNLIYIKLVIDTLKQNNVPFLMTYVDDLLFDKRWHLSPAVESLQSYVLPFMTQFDGKSFLEWSKDQGFAISEKWHPLESAHRAAASHMIKFFDKQKIIDPTPPVPV